MPERDPPLSDPHPSPRRRRRHAQTPAPAPKPAATEQRGGWRQFRSRFLSSWGLSTTFRIYIFLGGIVVVMGILLYNEAMIRDLKDQERRRVHLHAFLYSVAGSHMATDAQADFIFQEVINNPQGDFPIIFTDHRGEIIFYKGSGLPDESDTTLAARQQLARTLERMDARNEPIPYYFYPQAVGYLYRDGGAYAIADADGYPLLWGGAPLPAEDDTTLAAQAQVQGFIDEMPGRRFEIPAEGFSNVHYDGDNLVLTDPKGRYVLWDGPALPAQRDTTAAASTQVRRLLERMDLQHEPRPLSVPSQQYIHYGDSALVGRISWAVFVQVGAIALFALIGFAGFLNIRRSEQRSIWVGMAKETAHQLGTPLSSLSGWLELIQTAVSQRPQAPLEEVGAMTAEMQKDMRRLTQIASRFSQIGSVPELVPTDVGAVLAETANYFQTRSPQFGKHDIRLDRRPAAPVPLNADLIGWAFENLFKNAMDAIGRGPGSIAIRIGQLPDQGTVRITFTDNGGGIRPENFNRIFQPGFSTKKRGWGLGLAFVRRIIEEYHNGSIRVLRSAPGEGTTFEILLPTA